MQSLKLLNRTTPHRPKPSAPARQDDGMNRHPSGLIQEKTRLHGHDGAAGWMVESEEDQSRWNLDVDGLREEGAVGLPAAASAEVVCGADLPKLKGSLVALRNQQHQGLLEDGGASKRKQRDENGSGQVDASPSPEGPEGSNKRQKGEASLTEASSSKPAPYDGEPEVLATIAAVAFASDGSPLPSPNPSPTERSFPSLHVQNHQQPEASTGSSRHSQNPTPSPPPHRQNGPTESTTSAKASPPHSESIVEQEMAAIAALFSDDDAAFSEDDVDAAERTTASGSPRTPSPILNHLCDAYSAHFGSPRTPSPIVRPTDRSPTPLSPSTITDAVDSIRENDSSGSDDDEEELRVVALPLYVKPVMVKRKYGPQFGIDEIERLKQRQTKE
ncbi:hypothetical protein HDU67_007805 [Dinochytrium kinnereticum]|nr:hypothetical protein HDU67_007805 [Dinochytrium kinnereticum]